MSSCDRRIIFHQIFLNLPIFHTSYFACSAKSIEPRLNGIRQTSKTDSKYFVANTRIFVFFLLATVGGLGWSTFTYPASCYALVGQWAWFIGGEVTINSDGTFTQQSGNAGTWEDPNPYLKGKAEAASLCVWALNISPLVVARCPAKGVVVRTVTMPRLPSRQTLAQLLSDLSWLKEMNPTGNPKNCGNAVLGKDQYLARGEMHPAAPMSCETVPS